MSLEDEIRRLQESGSLAHPVAVGGIDEDGGGDGNGPKIEVPKYTYVFYIRFY
jgi:hypothetical protein